MLLPDLLGNRVSDPLRWHRPGHRLRLRRVLAGIKAASPMSSFEELERLYSDLQRWKVAEAEVSNAYLRLRRLIPGALDTPHAPTAHQVWSTTEEALKKALAVTRPHSNTPEK